MLYFRYLALQSSVLLELLIATECESKSNPHEFCDQLILTDAKKSALYPQIGQCGVTRWETHLLSAGISPGNFTSLSCNVECGDCKNLLS